MKQEICLHNFVVITTTSLSTSASYASLNSIRQYILSLLLVRILLSYFPNSSAVQTTLSSIFVLFLCEISILF